MEVVKKEMARVNIDILGISELKWAGMGELNSVSLQKVEVSAVSGDRMTDVKSHGELCMNKMFWCADVGVGK